MCTEECPGLATDAAWKQARLQCQASVSSPVKWGKDRTTSQVYSSPGAPVAMCTPVEGGYLPVSGAFAKLSLISKECKRWRKDEKETG